MKKLVFLLTFCLPLVSSAQLKLNEFLLQNRFSYLSEDGANFQWVEVFNQGSETVDVNAYSFVVGSTTLQISVSGSTIDTGAFMVFDFGLSDSAVADIEYIIPDSVRYLALIDSAGNIVDEVFYPEQEIDISYGRYIDGALPWIQFAVPTRGSTNESGASIGEFTAEEFTVYPNPVSHGVVFFSSPLSGWLIAANGKVVRQFNNKNQLQVESLSSGVYFLYSATHQTVKKLIIP